MLDLDTEPDSSTEMQQKKSHGDRDSDQTIIAQIASFVSAQAKAPVTESARLAALRCILDLVGAAAAGSNNIGAAAARTQALNMMAPGAVPIWFSNSSSSAVGAAWANSASASALDLDDGHRLARGHPGAAVIPTAVAVAQEIGATFEQMIAAIVIGYEVGVIIAASRLTYGNTGTWSAYAVVATAAALRRTPPNVLEHALAIAGESSPNQLFAGAPAHDPAPEGSDVKEGIPWSVVTGFAALALAESGHTGPRNILNSTLFYRFSKKNLTEAEPQICRTYFKMYACCRHVHAPLDAMQALLTKHRIDAHEIDGIEVETYSGALRISNKANPENLVDIQYSIPYCLALVALAGPQQLLPLKNRAIGNPGAVALAQRVSLELNTEFDRRFPEETVARVTIVCGQSRYRSEPTTPRGDASDPLTWEQLFIKFRELARGAANEADLSSFIEAIGMARDGDPDRLMIQLTKR